MQTLGRESFGWMQRDADFADAVRVFCHRPFQLDAQPCWINSCGTAIPQREESFACAEATDESFYGCQIGRCVKRSENESTLFVFACEPITSDQRCAHF